MHLFFRGAPQRRRPRVREPSRKRAPAAAAFRRATQGASQVRRKRAGCKRLAPRALASREAAARAPGRRSSIFEVKRFVRRKALPGRQGLFFQAPGEPLRETHRRARGAARAAAAVDGDDVLSSLGGRLS